MEKITIKDIAREMGVSISTVSRAFNNKYDINAETKAEILKKSAELGYAPNLFAKQLSSKKTFIIGVVVPEFINSFFPRVIKGIQSVMNGAGYQVLIIRRISTKRAGKHPNFGKKQYRRYYFIIISR